jgi:hypothetical protein
VCCESDVYLGVKKLRLVEKGWREIRGSEKGRRGRDGTGESDQPVTL